MGLGLAVFAACWMLALVVLIVFGARQMFSEPGPEGAFDNEPGHSAWD